MMIVLALGIHGLVKELYYEEKYFENFFFWVFIANFTKIRKDTRFSLLKSLLKLFVSLPMVET